MCNKNNRNLLFSLKSAGINELTPGADLLSKNVLFLCNHVSEHTEGASLPKMIDIREC